MALEYTIRRKILTLFGAKFHLYDASGACFGFCKQKAFKLREDIRVYTDESLQRELLLIKARQIVDFSAAYDIWDSRTQQKVGALKRKGWSSMLRDAWIVMDSFDQPVGQIAEDSLGLALVRRFLSNLVPQHFHLRDTSGREVASFRTHFNPFVYRQTVRVQDDCPLNGLLVLGAGLLLAAIEGRQG